ncbi:DUF4178 domain-containing protein [Pseudooceanicola sp. 216_PA32_1]|uniref:DUF4178 domain-containing protein n=1 Tax=Pseudooceanicola pacificus TaxID=2676438 RepID=A0A844WAG3_9RHOB|nr:DUF4178 domain-containing protein [Pseudooceanicola pacificus]MWB76682.1 DUF4178 domain-containing protein [Pseudooceanicola pacificus]
MPDLNCPNCGDRIDPRIAGFRRVSCASCGTSLLLEDEVVRQAGQAGVMHEAPLLFGIGDTVHIWDMTFDIVGHARFAYGRGWWDEFQAFDGEGRLFWLSIDEGDVAVQRPVPPDRAPRFDGPPALGAGFRLGDQRYTVNETDRAECVAIRGGIDEDMDIGETHDFVNCTGSGGDLLSGEFWSTGRAWFIGDWADPFEITVERQGR